MEFTQQQLLTLSRPAADLILLDKFSSLVAGIESGRLCFENLKKSILCECNRRLACDIQCN